MEGDVAVTHELTSGAAVLSTDARTFLQHKTLHEEVFGPSTLVVRCRTLEEATDVAGRLGTRAAMIDLPPRWSTDRKFSCH